MTPKHLHPLPSTTGPAVGLGLVPTLVYVESDVPPGMTLVEWRRGRAEEAGTPRRRTLRARRRAAVRAMLRAAGL